jgi:NAD(P)-dependent dehydrogenase (short-subunit alcohol dehydrogenase family)
MTSKAALITGAAMGIGRAVAERFAADGWQLLLMDMAEEPLFQCAAQLRKHNPAIETLVGSVASEQDCLRAADAARSAFGGLHTLSHNAGIQRYGNIEQTDGALWDEVMNVNLKGAYLISRAVINMIRDSPGSIVHMASVQGLASQDNVAAYATSKHGLIGLTHSMAVDYAPYGVRVNAVAPGAVDTPMLKHSIALAEDREHTEREINHMHPLGRMAKASEVAGVVAFLASNDASFVTGEVIRVDGGMLASIKGSPKQ